MGIIYQFAIRFITVKDITKVDKRCITSTDDDENDDDFNDYLVKAKENCAVKLKEVSLDPGRKRSYTVENISVPEATQVITFGNNACDRWGGCYYEIQFYYDDVSEDYEEVIGANNESNRFMIVLKPSKSRLLRMDYSISDGGDFTYTEDDCESIIL